MRIFKLIELFILSAVITLSPEAAVARQSGNADSGISQVKLIGGNASEMSTLKANAKKQGWTVIESNLNAGNKGDIIYLCYKTGSGRDRITDLYLSSSGNPVSGTITVGGRSYTLCPTEGGKHFLDIKGDLNSNAGGDDIHLYYTKDSFGNGRVVTNIWFNASSGGAVGKNGTSTPYDLNKGAGGDDIFMHIETTAGSSQTTTQTTTSTKPSTTKSGKGISAVKLIGGNSSEMSTLKANAKKQGWTVIESNLNAGNKGDIIYLCYKTGSGNDLITDLYLSSSGNPVNGKITVSGRSYTLCPTEGGKHFLDIKGDLNSNSGGDDIHLYYTKDSFGNGRVITGIWFNSTSSGAVGKNGTGSPYDLNKGAGGNEIFMHVDATAGAPQTTTSTKPSTTKSVNGISAVKLIGGSSSEVSTLKANAKKQGWTVIESDLNAGTRGDVIYLCYKTGSGDDCVTDLYLSSSGNPVSGAISVSGRTYNLCPTEGGKHFLDIKGDLNSNAGGDDIHIYYTKAAFSDGRVVTDIWFNASSSGAVGKNGTGSPYDLNKGAGGNDIFMHFSTK